MYFYYFLSTCDLLPVSLHRFLPFWRFDPTYLQINVKYDKIKMSNEMK